MNEISMLMHLLSKKTSSYQIGATKKEILRALNVKNKNKSIQFHSLIVNLSNYLEPLGLQIKFNPLNSCWFISFDADISDAISANPFEGKPKLAASLFCALAVCLKNSGTGAVSEMGKLRNKKNVLEDLKDLERMGYIEFKKDIGSIKLTPLIGYQLDLEKLLFILALNKLKEDE